MNIEIDTIVRELKEGKSPKTQQSLEKLNEILHSYYKNGLRDFSITTIGRVSSNAGGLGYNSLRATSNRHYRQLIEAWAAKAKTTTKKPHGKHSRSRQVPKDTQLLERIPEIAVRAIFGQIIAERNQLRNQYNLLKNQTEIIIDRRPIHHSGKHKESSTEIILSPKELVSENELKALEHAASNQCIEDNDWTMTPLGQIKDNLDREIFQRGFMTGLRKLITYEKQ